MALWERLHKMGCGFIVYRRCLFGTTAEHLGQVGEEIIGCILFPNFTPSNNHVTKHLRNAVSIGINSGHVPLCHVLYFSQESRGKNLALETPV